MKNRPLCFLCLLLLCVQVVITMSGKNLAEIPASSIFYEQEEKSVSVQGQVYKKSKTSKIQILYLKNNSVSDSKLMIYDKNFTDIPIGKTITVEGTLGFFDGARNPGNFDQKLYYARMNIYGYIWCERIEHVSGEGDVLKEKLYQVKETWKQLLYETIGEKNGAILAAILLGEKSEMDPDMKELYQKNGVGHVFAISGLHISFIGLGCYKCLRKGGLPFWVSGACAMVLLGLYVMMIGVSVSVFRAAVMLLIRIGADITGRTYDMATALMLAAALTVVYQPLYLTDGAFYMSYGAILGIISVLPVIQKKRFAGLYTSISVNLILLPILLWFYFEISTYSVFLNMLIVPVISVVLGFGLIGSGLLCLFRPAGILCLSVCDVLLDVCELCNLFGSRLPFARIVAGRPGIWEVVFYYLVLGLILFVMYKRKKKRHVWWLLLAIPFLLLVTERTEGLRVTMVDVGQGDCIFIEDPSGKTYLIDGGSNDVDQVGKYRLEPFLKSQGVALLDYVFLTHGDSDHYSGIEEMLKRQEMGVKISCLVLPALYERDEALCTLAEIAEKEDIKVAVMESGQFIQTGEFQITCLQPDEADRDLEGNAASMVLDVRYQSFSMLCTGDVEEKGETELVKKLPSEAYDVLKVAHHGSKYSGSEEFLKIVRPKIALISAGEDNGYGHPHKETIGRLKNAGCEIYQTMKSGAITLWSDGKSLTISTFPL